MSSIRERLIQGGTMDNEIICPNCQRKITGHPIIEEAAKGVGSDNQFLVCECGERITYRQINTQLRNQEKVSAKIQTWLEGLLKDHG
jgi:uncharacterized protein DUF953